MNESPLAYLSLLTLLLLAIYFWKHLPYDPVGESGKQVLEPCQSSRIKGKCKKQPTSSALFPTHPTHFFSVGG